MIEMNTDNTTVVICCAGMGTRLGIGTTKALVSVCDKPLILHQLELLKDYKDVRIVVGFQAEKVMKVVKQYRDDVMFAFNYEYESNGPAASLSRGLVGAKEYVITIDGDLLVNPEDFRLFLDYQGECLAASNITSDEPVLLSVEDGMAKSFLKKNSNFEWPGLAKIKKNKLQMGKGYIYETIQTLLPLKTINIRARGIDTPDDYERTVEWVKNRYLN